MNTNIQSDDMTGSNYYKNPTVSYLNKRIKFAKTPMERKMYERQLHGYDSEFCKTRKSTKKKHHH